MGEQSNKYGNKNDCQSSSGMNKIPGGNEEIRGAIREAPAAECVRRSVRRRDN
jgi:hypothetical protein